MNAQELLTNTWDGLILKVQQQADRIAELEKEKEHLKGKVALLGIKDGFQRMQEQTNAEPVAYIDPYDLERLPHYDCHIGSQQLKNGIPLYTTLFKQVTWKNVENYEELYEVSTNGDIRNKKTGKLLAKSLMGAGYIKADLWKNNKRWQTSVHRIVAQTFIENINGYKEVNHINGIKTDNRAENLEWVTRTENVNHSLYELGNRIKGVFAINLKTGETRKYPSVVSVEKDGFEPKNVSEVCRMENRYTHKGWSFKFIEDTTPQTKPLSDEEIEEIREKCSWASGYVYWKEFARAIEERILGK